MASGVINGTTNNKYIFSKIEWSSETDRVNNRSTITAIFSAMKSTQSTEGTTGQGTWYLEIGGTKTSVSKQMDVPNDGQWREITRNTVIVDHDPDGSKSVQIIGSGGTLRTTWATTTCSGVAILETIPRETFPTFDSKTKNFGSTLTISLSPAEDTFTHDVSVQYQTTTQTIRTGIASGNISYSIPSEWMNSIPNALASTMYVITSTYEGTRLVGTTTESITLNVPETVVPVISSVVLTDTGGIIPSAWGIFVRGKSTLHAKINAVGAYGSTITSYQIEALDQTRSANDIDIGSIETYGSISVKATVYDSRGRSATTTVNQSVVDYSSPVIDSIFIERANDQGTPVDNGTFLKLTMSAAVASIDNHNTITINVYHQRSDAEERTLARTITPSSLRLYDAVYMIANMETSRSYEVTVEIVDYFGAPTTSTGMLPAEGGVISWKNGGTGVAFGKAAEEDYRADFGWKIHAREGAEFDVPIEIASGGTGANDAETARTNLEIPTAVEGLINSLVPSLVVDLLYPVGSLYITTNSTDPSTVFTGTTWEQIKDTFLVASGDDFSAGSTGGSSSHELNATHKHLAPIGYSNSAVGFISVNGTENGGKGKAYKTSDTNHSGTLSANVALGYTSEVTIEDTISTIPPYLAVYVWKRTE